MTDRLDHRSALLTKPDPANPYTVSESERTESGECVKVAGNSNEELQH